MAKVTKPGERDLNQELADALGAAEGAASRQLKQQRTASAGMIKDSILGTEVIASKLDPRYGTKGYAENYTLLGREQVDAAAENFGRMGEYANRLGALSGEAEGDIGDTEIEAELRRQALADLQLGRQLSPEEERAAQQSARAAFSARGLGMGQPAAAAEILNRDALATSRLDARRGFAGNVNQTLTQNRLSRLGAAGGLLGQTAGAYQNMGASQQGLAQSYVGLDPFGRALGSNIPIAAQQTSANMIGNAYGQVLGYAADVNNTNYNAKWSDYLNTQNMAAANRMGQMQLGAAKSAGNNALLGAGIGAAGMVAGAGLIAF